MNHGFLPDIIQEDHYVLGSGMASKRFGAAALMPDGHGWGKYKPEKELQNKNGVETLACTVYGSLNAWETLANYYDLHDFPKDCSERFNAILAGITRSGGSPHRSCESIRESGVIPEQTLPFDGTIYSWDYYYSPKPMDPALASLGKRILRKYVFGHEWVWPDGTVDRPTRLKSALSRGPVCVSMHAWKEKNGMYYKDKGDADNHWLQLLDYKEGKYWLVYDHYEKDEKKITWDTEFECAKLYFLAIKEETMIEKLQRQVIELLQKLVTALNPSSVVPEAPKPAPEPVPVPEVPKPLPEVPKPAPKPIGVDYGKWPTLVKAIIQVESGGVDTAIGDKHLKDKAYGSMQIRKPVCLDVNKVYGTFLRAEDMLGNRQLSVDTFYKYMDIYVTKKRLGREPTDEDRARAWNGGGPSGWKRDTTIGYWAKVKRYL